MKTNKTQITIGILIILLLIAGGYILNEEYIKPKQIEYAQQGALQIVNEINTNGNIPVINNGTIKWISIQEICGK